MNALIEAAQEMGISDHVSFNGRLVMLAYPPKVQQRPIPDRIDKQQAIKMLGEMLKFVQSR